MILDVALCLVELNIRTEDVCPLVIVALVSSVFLKPGGSYKEMTHKNATHKMEEPRDE
jgi:hypothetical protein